MTKYDSNVVQRRLYQGEDRLDRGVHLFLTSEGSLTLYWKKELSNYESDHKSATLPKPPESLLRAFACWTVGFGTEDLCRQIEASEGWEYNHLWKFGWQGKPFPAEEIRECCELLRESDKW